MSSLCPVCGKGTCDHATEERGQTMEEMMRPMSDEEAELWRTEPEGSPALTKYAKEHAHDPT